jgi:hypothetical protein
MLFGCVDGDYVRPQTHPVQGCSGARHLLSCQTRDSHGSSGGIVVAIEDDHRANRKEC